MHGLVATGFLKSGQGTEQTGQKDEEPGFKSRIRVNLDKGCKQIS
jgi:hypothetical protein